VEISRGRENVHTRAPGVARAFLKLAAGVAATPDDTSVVNGTSHVVALRPLLTMGEAAVRLGCSVETVRRIARRSDLHATRLTGTHSRRGRLGAA
jgi:excisionase family DNA binding protein